MSLQGKSLRVRLNIHRSFCRLIPLRLDRLSFLHRLRHHSNLRTSVALYHSPSLTQVYLQLLTDLGKEMNYIVDHPIEKIVRPSLAISTLGLTILPSAPSWAPRYGACRSPRNCQDGYRGRLALNYWAIGIWGVALMHVAWSLYARINIFIVHVLQNIEMHSPDAPTAPVRFCVPNKSSMLQTRLRVRFSCGYSKQQQNRNRRGHSV